MIDDREAETVYGVPGTPFVIVLDQHGIVRAKGTVNNLEQVEGLDRHRGATLDGG